MLENFYSTPRLGAVRLSDGGGPFGFDITVACQVDHAVRHGDLHVIIETGTFLGDTTEYLGRQYPDLPVISIEIQAEHVAIARARCRDLPNVEIVHGDSAIALPEILATVKHPFVYLDAHWLPEWPLSAELGSLETGVVAIDDFDLCHRRFGFDTFDGQPLNADYIRGLLADHVSLFAGNPFTRYPYPCLQVGRRTGTAFANLDGSTLLFQHDYFMPID